MLTDRQIQRNVAESGNRSSTSEQSICCRGLRQLQNGASDSRIEHLVVAPAQLSESFAGEHIITSRRDTRPRGR